MDISHLFIDQLFTHSYFTASLQTFYKNLHLQTTFHQQSTSQTIQSVVNQISEILQLTVNSTKQKSYRLLHETNRQILDQIQNLKSQLKTLSPLNTQSSTVQIDNKSKYENSILFENEDQYDLKEYRKTLEQQLESKIFISSFSIDQQQSEKLNREKSQIDEDIKEKINASLEGSIQKIELTLEEKFGSFATKIQLRIEQLTKTIASIVEEMNEQQLLHKSKLRPNTNPSNLIFLNSFLKKQAKLNQQNQDMSSKINETQSNRSNEFERNPQNQKEQTHLNYNKTKQNNQTNSNKAIESINKSIIQGRSKIKSFFRFNQTKKSRESQRNQNIQV